MSNAQLLRRVPVALDWLYQQAAVTSDNSMKSGD